MHVGDGELKSFLLLNSLGNLLKLLKDVLMDQSIKKEVDFKIIPIISCLFQVVRIIDLVKPSIEISHRCAHQLVFH